MEKNLKIICIVHIYIQINGILLFYAFMEKKTLEFYILKEKLLLILLD